jgi:tRNA dimethylallyltransferase
MNKENSRTIICLMGPTASGKTDLALELVQKYPFEIISVDSAMIYRDMNIGTAKPTADILKIAPHHLINIRDPAEAYSAANFVEDATRAIEKIFANKKIPLLVGGTMMYFHALQQGLAVMPAASAEIREKLNQEIQEKGLAELHARLQKIDPIAAARIHSNDSQRIQRALEVYELTGKNISSWQKENSSAEKNFKIMNLAIVPDDRKILHDRIAVRFQKMLDEGFVEEVKKLFDRGDLNLAMPSMRSVGYRQVWEYLLGNDSFDEMREKGIIATRQLAKRQLTWLRSWENPVIASAQREAIQLFSDVVTGLLRAARSQ